MSATYAKELKVAAVGGTTVCVELPAHMRGKLERITIVQSSGIDVVADFTVYNRRGAIEGQFDLHVKGGGISSSADNGGNAQFETDADHNRLPGNLVYIKGTGQAAYDNAYHTVLTVESATEFTVDTAHASVVSTGVWQTPPLDEYPILAPTLHEMLADSIVAGQAYQGANLELNYENRDNQDPTARRRHAALWLCLKPVGTGDQEWSIAIATASDVVV